MGRALGVPDVPLPKVPPGPPFRASLASARTPQGLEQGLRVGEGSPTKLERDPLEHPQVPSRLYLPRSW